MATTNEIKLLNEDFKIVNSLLWYVYNDLKLARINNSKVNDRMLTTLKECMIITNKVMIENHIDDSIRVANKLKVVKWLITH